VLKRGVGIDLRRSLGGCEALSLITRPHVLIPNAPSQLEGLQTTWDLKMMSHVGCLRLSGRHIFNVTYGNILHSFSFGTAENGMYCFSTVFSLVFLTYFKACACICCCCCFGCLYLCWWCICHSLPPPPHAHFLRSCAAQ